jgi:superfamily I DNA/RNA helicase
VLDDNALWRRCENAWAQWLESDGCAVTRLTDATSNTPHSGAPLITIGGRQHRAPDLLATRSGSSQYWEVKTRSRSEVDPLTGQRTHWMSHDAFRDYLTVSRAAQMRVWVVLYEAPSSASPGRWLRSDVRRLAEVGSVTERRGSGGQVVKAWSWPVSEMEVVEGPVLDVATEQVPLLPREGEGEERDEAVDDLEPIEKSLRRRRGAPKEHAEPSPTIEVEETSSKSPSGADRTGLPHWLDEEPALALDVLRRSLGMPHFPRYSVLHVGDDVDVDELFGLMHYGIRVFLVTSTEPTLQMTDVELTAFKESRLLEWAVVAEASGCSAWVVDGAWPTDLTEEAKRAVEAADDSGGVNLAQYRVVHAPEASDLMVTAGAGTGKTETMSERIVYLLATSGSHETAVGSHPVDLRADEIALITFTRESAAEMRHRVARTLLLRQRLCRRCALPVLAWMLQLASSDIVTIHSLAKRLAASSAGVLGLGPEFRVARRTLEIREATYRALSEPLSALIKQHPNRVPPAYEWVRHVQAVWDALENNGVDLLRLGSATDSTAEVEWGASPSSGLDAAIVETTHSVLIEVSRQVRAMCLTDQTLPTNQLVPAATAALNKQDDAPVRQYRYVFVDEFQDTDAAQMELILSLRQKLDCRLLVVGDAKQGIYRFRGAEGNAFEEMERRVAGRGLPAMSSYPLTRNFRSGKRLLASLHPHFSAWGGKKLLPYEPKDQLRAKQQPTDASSAVVLEGISSNDTAAEAAARVSRWRTLHEGTSVGVLCRQNWQAVKVQEEVRKLGIPCELRVGGSFYESPAVRELRVLLEAVADPLDDAALLELCETRWAAGILHGEPPVDVPVVTWGEPAEAPMLWAARFASASATGSFTRDDLDPLRQRLGNLGMMLRTMPVLAWVVECARTFRPEACSLPETDDETERVRYGRCFDHLVTLMDGQFRDSPTTLERLLSWLRLQIATNRFEDEPEGDTDGKVVALTVHKSKGLEFDRVIVPFTGVTFGPPRSVTTRTSVLRPPGATPRLLWRWTLNRGSRYETDFSNVPLARQQEWHVDDADTAKEEARLLYVAMTRARDELILFVDPRTKDGVSSPTSWAELLKAGG